MTTLPVTRRNVKAEGVATTCRPSRFIPRVVWFLALAPIGLIPDSRANPLSLATVGGVNVSLDKVSVAAALAATVFLRAVPDTSTRYSLCNPLARSLAIFAVVTTMLGLLAGTSETPGALAFVAAMGIAEYLTFCRLFRAGESAIFAAYWLAFAGCLNGALALYQRLSGSTWPVAVDAHTVRGFYDAHGARVFRATGLISEPQVLATLAVVSFVAISALLGRARTRWRPPLLIAAAMSLIGLVLSFSRGGIFVGVAIVVAWILFGARAQLLRRIVAAAVGTSVLWFIERASVASLLDHRLHNTTDGSYSTRMSTWTAVWDYISAQDLVHLLVGNGLGANMTIRNAFGPIDNAYLTIVLEIGIAGLALLAVAAASTARLRGDARWLKYCVLAIALNGMSYEVQYYSSLLPLIALAMAAMAVRKPGVRERHSPVLGVPNG